ncbi:hypothetical protein A2619_03460 [candidate division WWE3 bacterium RIFOXYD1_FULL_39_9]|uniref:Uncharacterized protein n=1 Tax=candidate division WWE3 bacterium RIFOXYD1_FULL_39_9 TaxID=1802649 RepID=A0A1F4X5K7_UNCKA|nr:MAG: hypothetical protein A2619_03460 [candidate division WWE3 bacterium RIFOXYD1_FULL_39_9]
MSTFDVDLRTINPQTGDIIVLQLDVDNIPYFDLDDFMEMQDKLKEAFPRNKIILLAKSDNFLVCKNKKEVQEILNELS